MDAENQAADGGVASIEEAREEARKKKSVPARIANEIREHPFAYSVMAGAMVMGPILASMIFPEASLGVKIVGGLAVGGYAGVCAVPGKFF